MNKHVLGGQNQYAFGLGIMINYDATTVTDNRFINSIFNIIMPNMDFYGCIAFYSIILP